MHACMPDPIKSSALSTTAGGTRPFAIGRSSSAIQHPPTRPRERTTRQNRRVIFSSLLPRFPSPDIVLQLFPSVRPLVDEHLMDERHTRSATKRHRYRRHRHREEETTMNKMLESAPRELACGEKRGDGVGGAHLLQLVEHVGVELAQPQEGKRGTKPEPP